MFLWFISKCFGDICMANYLMIFHEVIDLTGMNANGWYWGYSFPLRTDVEFSASKSYKSLPSLQH